MKKFFGVLSTAFFILGIPVALVGGTIHHAIAGLLMILIGVLIFGILVVVEAIHSIDGKRT